MGYEIHYSQKRNKMLCMRRGKVKIWVLVVVLVTAYLLYNRGDAKEFLIPGRAEITEAAFNELSDNLRTGVPIKEAFAEFYLYIHSHEAIF